MVRTGDIIRHVIHGQYYLCCDMRVNNGDLKVKVHRKFDSDGVAHIRRYGLISSYQKVQIPTDMTESERKAWVTMTNKLTQ